MADPKPLDRAVLAAFLPNHEAIKAFEKLIQMVSINLPADIVDLNVLVEEIGIAASLADAKGESALALLSSIAGSLEVLAAAPRWEPPTPEGLILPSSQLYQPDPVLPTITPELIGALALNGTAKTVETNANLTGPITSVGNATAVASQTGTGSKFVMDTSPTLVTPTIGVATATSVNKVAVTAPATSATLTIQDGKTLSYEEGTWTPSLGGTATYLDRSGKYTKIGRMVNFSGVVYVNALGTGSANTISGLPFTVVGIGGTCAVPSCGGSAVAFTEINLNVYSTSIQVSGMTAAGVANQAALNVFTAGTYLEVSGSYMTT